MLCRKIMVPKCNHLYLHLGHLILRLNLMVPHFIPPNKTKIWVYIILIHTGTH